MRRNEGIAHLFEEVLKHSIWDYIKDHISIAKD